MDDETTRAGDPLAADSEDRGQSSSNADTTMPAQDGGSPPPATDAEGDGAGNQGMTTMPAGDVEGYAGDDVDPPANSDTRALGTEADLGDSSGAPDSATTEDAASAAPDMTGARDGGETVAMGLDGDTAQGDTSANATPDMESAGDGGDTAAAGADGETDADGDATAQDTPRPRSGGGLRGGRGGSSASRGGYGGQGSDMAALLEESEQQFRQLKYGDVLEGRIMRRDPDEMLVDIGSKSEGVIPMSEMSSLTPDELAALDVGSEVLVSVVQAENQEGHVVLSLDKARQERSWRNLQKKFEAGEILDAEVTGYNKGGLLVNLEGVRGFVPASQVSGLSSGSNESIKQSELSRYTGQHLPLKIIEINRNRNRLILSERQAAQEQRDHRKEQLLSELHAGQIRDGMVSSICDFGAFVDIGGADGLIHLSELSWSRVNHPSEVLKVGQPVQVYVMSVDERDRKIALSLKRTQPEPWSTVMDRYQLGQMVRGTITQMTDFGAFARLEDGIEGLIHVSELADGRVTHPRNVVQEGWQLTLRVIRIDPQRRRMGLSLKRAMEEQEGDTMPPQEALPIIPGRPAPEPAPAAEGGERPTSAPPPRFERGEPRNSGSGSTEPRSTEPRSGDRGPRPDRGRDGGRDGGRGGRREGGYEPTPQMPAQPQLETAMAQAFLAANEATAVNEQDETTRNDEGYTAPAQDSSSDAGGYTAHTQDEPTADDGGTAAPMDAQASPGDAGSYSTEAQDEPTGNDGGYSAPVPEQDSLSDAGGYSAPAQDESNGTDADTKRMVQPETPVNTYTSVETEDAAAPSAAPGDLMGDLDSGTPTFQDGGAADDGPSTTQYRDTDETS